MHEPATHSAQHARAELAHLVGLDHLGQAWIRSADSMRREVAWVAEGLDGPTLERAITQHDFVLVQRVDPHNLAIICAVVRARVTPPRPKLTPHQHDGVLHADALSLGNGKASLSVRGNTLHIEADSIVSFARGRHRIVGGSVELG